MKEWRPKSALRVAARNGHLEMIKKLIAAGSDVNAETGGGYRDGLSTPVQAATRHGYYEAVKLLLEHGARPDALLIASQRGDMKLLKMLLENGADTSAIAGLEAFLECCLKGEITGVKLLVEHGVDVTQSAYAPFAAVESGSITAVRYILDHGADANTANLLHYSASRGHVDILEVLLGRGADIHALDQKRGQTVLQTAIYSRNGNIGCGIRYIDARAVWGRVSKHKTLRVCQLLLDRGININFRTTVNEQNPHLTALEAALCPRDNKEREKTREAVALLLLERGAKSIPRLREVPAKSQEAISYNHTDNLSPISETTTVA